MIPTSTTGCGIRRSNAYTLSNCVRKDSLIERLERLLSRMSSDSAFEVRASGLLLTNEDESCPYLLPVAQQSSVLPILSDIIENKTFTLTYTQKLGWGIAAREYVQEGEFLTALLSSDWLTLAEIRAATDAIDEGLLNPAALKILYDVIQVEEDKFLLPTPTAGFLFNHSCDPNAALVRTKTGFEFRAIKRISVGEEIHWDYATSIGDWFTLQCRCGSENCQGIVAGPLSLSLKARTEMLELFGEDRLLSHVVRWLRRTDCPIELTGERYLRDFEGEATMKIDILTKHPRLHPEVHKRVQAALMEYFERTSDADNK